MFRNILRFSRIVCCSTTILYLNYNAATREHTPSFESFATHCANIFNTSYPPRSVFSLQYFKVGVFRGFQFLSEDSAPAPSKVHYLLTRKTTSVKVEIERYN